jgi:hypothetical protein
MIEVGIASMVNFFLYYFLKQLTRGLVFELGSITHSIAVPIHLETKHH